MTIKIAKQSEIEPTPLPKNSWVKKLLTEKTVGAKKMSMGVSKFRPGMVSEMMAHEEEELVIVIKGRGKLRLPDGEVRFEAGDGIYIPADQPHSNHRYSSGLIPATARRPGTGSGPGGQASGAPGG